MNMGTMRNVCPLLSLTRVISYGKDARRSGADKDFQRSQSKI